MGSGNKPTKTAKTARVQPNMVSADDVPPVSNLSGGQGKDLSIVIPLTDINEDSWRNLNRGDRVSVVNRATTILQVVIDAEYLGTIPPHYVETVLERQLFDGSCAVVGKVPSDLRVRLSDMG